MNIFFWRTKQDIQSRLRQFHYARFDAIPYKAVFLHAVSENLPEYCLITQNYLNKPTDFPFSIPDDCVPIIIPANENQPRSKIKVVLFWYLILAITFRLYTRKRIRKKEQSRRKRKRINRPLKRRNKIFNRKLIWRINFLLKRVGTKLFP